MSILKRINLSTDGHDQLRVNYVHRLVNLSSSGYAMQQCLLQTSQQVYYLHGYILLGPNVAGQLSDLKCLLTWQLAVRMWLPYGHKYSLKAYSVNYGKFRRFHHLSILLIYYIIPLCIWYFTKVLQLKDTLTRLEVFWQVPSSFNPQSWLPDLSTESTGRDCILVSTELRP